MPFKSNAQRKYLFSQHPEVAREFADATPKGAKLPEHVGDKKSKKEASAILTTLLLKRAADFTGETPDPGFAAAMDAQNARVNGQAARVAAKAHAAAARTPNLALPKPGAITPKAPLPVAPVTPNPGIPPAPSRIPAPVQLKEAGIDYKAKLANRLLAHGESKIANDIPGMPKQQLPPSMTAKPPVIPAAAPMKPVPPVSKVAAVPTPVKSKLNTPARYVDTATAIKKLAAVLKSRNRCV